MLFLWESVFISLFTFFQQGIPVVTKGLEEPNIPLVESVKDQHLLKPPPSMESSKFIL